MNMRCKMLGAFAAATGLLLSFPALAGEPLIIRSATDFNYPVIGCGDFEVWHSGWERDTEKYWFNELGEPVRLQWSSKVTESEFYNRNEPDKSIAQGRSGVGETVSVNFDLTTGDYHASGLSWRLTIPGVGHVLMDIGTWFWDDAEQMYLHHGPGFAVAVGNTGPALCEALE